MLLADWSVELIRNRRKKGKAKKTKKGEKSEEKVEVVEPRVLVCPDCEGRSPGMGLEDCDTLYKLYRLVWVQENLWLQWKNL